MILKPKAADMRKLNKFITDQNYSTTAATTTGLIVNELLFYPHIVTFQPDYTRSGFAGFLMVGINEEQKLKRRKKWQKMYIQSVLQDFIQLIDIANYNFTSKLMDTELWSFIFCSLSFAMVYALDGAVMVYFNIDWSFCCIDPKKSSVFVSGAQSSTVKPGGKSNRLIIN
ncbi:hypothetical protein L3Y34_006675 [Caenorhabditis briggsae]|uniref:7TM GPCR serpentine receptor class x (Srx) domain-containing protein n=1 Tax=Caenorhabditis briggsae TaxID=6238 RepID=A0AAE9A4U9_CAEBR|nr:hypothetical protein L3Y34_006675 [Caenorhabditis briggsae]